MTGLVGRLRGMRLARNLGALGYGQVIQIVGQLVLIPVFAIHWGLTSYGVWLILFTIPSYLAVSDLGLASAATSDMIMTRAKGDLGALASTFVTMRRAQFAMGLAVVALGAALLYLIAPGIVDFAQAAANGQAQAVTLALVAYGAISLQQAGLIGGMKAADRYAWISVVQASGYGLETLVAAGLVLAGQGLLVVALGYMLVRLATTLAIGRALHRAAPWLVDGSARFAFVHLRRLARPALAALSFTLGMAFSIQLMTVIVGARAGVAAVPVFSTVRTVSRIAFQMTAQICTAVMPLFGVAHSTGRRGDQGALVILAMGTTLAVLIPAMAVLVLLGPEAIAVWTGGTIVAPRLLVAAMGAVMLLDGAGLALSNLLLAINRHQSFALAYLLLATGALGLAWWWTPLLGPLGAALALMVLGALMLAQLVWAARRNGLLDGAGLREGVTVLRQRLAALRGRAS